MADNQLLNEIGDEIKDALKVGLTKGDFSALNEAILGSVNKVIDEATDQLEKSTGYYGGPVNVSTHKYSTYSNGAATRAKQKQLEKAEKRIQELDRLFVRTYEDNVSGKLSDERFAAMSRGYEEEQQDLKEAADTLRKEIEVQEQQNQNLDLFIERVQKYTALEELTPYVAHELIKAIYVGAPDKSSGKRRQSIHIEYDLIGFIPLNELMKQETA